MNNDLQIWFFVRKEEIKIHTDPTFFHIFPFDLTNLELKQCGTQQCQPGNSYGPAIRDIYLLHYIVSGKGHFNNGKTIYEIQPGDMFLITPGVSTFYQSSYEEPWRYTWVGFSGKSADQLLHRIGLSMDTPILRNTECYRYFDAMEQKCRDKESDAYSNSLFILGKLIQMFSYLCSFTTPQAYSVSDHIVDFFSNNIGSAISISQLAADFGFSRA